MSTLKSLQSFNQALAEVSKSVKIEISLEDLESLKKANYKLCFAKKVGDNSFNVVWQSYDSYLVNNTFSWVPQYQLFGSNTFQGNVKVQVATNTVNIGLGETSTLNESGILEPPFTGGPEISFTMENNYGSIHPGVNQLSTGIDGQTISTPIYVAEAPILKGDAVLTPVEQIMVWFQQNVETSTMFSTARSREVIIDLTTTDDATRLYKDGEWTTPS
ncbi:MAG: hypothetical protein AAGG75_26915 [Bacteroidota bacterium]